MDHLVDYIKWMGDVPFRGLPLNEADALVLCMLSYYDFSPLFQGRTKRLPLRESLRLVEEDKVRVLLVGSGEEYGHIRPGESPINEENHLRPADDCPLPLVLRLRLFRERQLSPRGNVHGRQLHL